MLVNQDLVVDSLGQKQRSKECVCRRQRELFRILAKTRIKQSVAHLQGDLRT